MNFSNSTALNVDQPVTASQTIEKRLLDLSNKREIGSLAHWSVSSCKQGFGVDQLRDDNLETYWQSDGSLPHHINIQFQRRMKITHVYFHVNFAQDESYTPHGIRLKVGSGFNDLHEVACLALEAPSGWHEINLLELHEEEIFGHYVQLCIESNHQLGKDCHVRQVKVFSDRPSFLQEGDDLPMNSIEFEQYTIIR